MNSSIEVLIVKMALALLRELAEDIVRFQGPSKSREPGALHDDAPARLVAAAAVARFSARENRRRLDDGRDGRSDATRHGDGVESWLSGLL